jgi:hypothetical protein
VTVRWRVVVQVAVVALVVVAVVVVAVRSHAATGRALLALLVHLVWVRVRVASHPRAVLQQRPHLPDALARLLARADIAALQLIGTPTVTLVPSDHMCVW